jgi:predicted nucleotidyltransferase
MNHQTRLRIARALKKKILKKYGNSILGIAVYGSVAKREDRMYSDLEMFVITERKPAVHEVRYVFRGMTVEVSYISARAMLSQARRVTPNWAIEADFYRSYMILYEKDTWFRKLEGATAMQDTQAFRKATKKYMVWLNELMGKIKNAYYYGNNHLFLWLTAFLGWESIVLLGLINRYYYRSERTLFDEVLTLPHTPRNYKQLLRAVFRFTPVDRATVYTGAQTLYRELRRLARTRGVELTDKNLRV